MICICFSMHLEAFLIVSKHILSPFRGFVASMLSEAKKKKVYIRSELLLLQMLSAANILVITTGEVTAEAGRSPLQLPKEQTKMLQLATTSKEEVLTCQWLPTTMEDSLALVGDYYSAQHCSLHWDKESPAHYM